MTRAPAAPQVAVLKADETGISVVQPATPAVPELVGKVVLDTISYTPAGEVLLKGAFASGCLGAGLSGQCPSGRDLQRR